MLVLVAILLALFLIPAPWGLVVVGVAAVLDIAETGVFVWWSKRRQARVGVQTLVGKQGIAVGDLWPEGQIKVDGEIWRARCTGGCDAGTSVVVREVEGLTLVVDPA